MSTCHKPQSATIVAYQNKTENLICNGILPWITPVQHMHVFLNPYLTEVCLYLIWRTAELNYDAYFVTIGSWNAWLHTLYTCVPD